MNKIVGSGVALILMLAAASAGAQGAPSQSHLKFKVNISGRFKGTLTLMDENGNAPRKVTCLHSLWAGYEYGEAGLVGPRRIITLRSSQRQVVFNASGLPGIKRVNQEKAAMHFVVQSVCDGTEEGETITSNPYAQYVVCGEGPYPAARVVTADRWLRMLRAKLLNAS